MKTVTTIAEVRAACDAARAAGHRVGFVPTMGFFHEGHRSLMRAARTDNDFVVLSLFVNPTQFGPNEDFARYPRNLEDDCAIVEQEGVHLVFAPSVEEMYPQGSVTWVTVEGLSDRLCGQSRPGHFRGVTTVVAKLFHVIEPDFAFFGQKDAAQHAIIRHMVRDLHMPVSVEVCPIVREPDGLALSSRNAYLNGEERKSALVLHRSLMRVRKVFESNERGSAKLIGAAGQEFATEPGARLDYFEVVDPDTLEPLPDVSAPSLVAVAAFVGKTRLIDNIVLKPEPL